MLHIADVGKDGVSPAFMYLGRLRLAKGAELKSNPAPGPKTKAN
jgi:hypothetical protein